MFSASLFHASRSSSNCIAHQSAPCFWLQRWRRVLSPDIVKLSGPCWRQLVPFIGSYHWPKRQCQASDKGLRPPGCKQKIVCESTRKRKIFQNIKFKIRNIFTLLCQHGEKSYFTPSNDARINYKSWEIRSGKNLYCLNWGVFLSCEKTIRLSVFRTWITASLFSVNHKISGPNLETL